MKKLTIYDENMTTTTSNGTGPMKKETATSEAEDIARKIFYSEATNGKADGNIKKGAEMIEDYANHSKQKLLESVTEEEIHDHCFWNYSELDRLDVKEEEGFIKGANWVLELLKERAGY